MKRLPGYTLPLLSVLLLAAISIPVDARRQRTTLQGKLTTTAAVSPADTVVAPAVTPLPDDTLTAALDSIVSLAGYDKPVSASRESMHVTNLTNSLTVTGFTLDITYLDATRRQLHRRTVTVNTHVPPRQTRLVTFPTWDVQRSFFYRLSVEPRRQATPYDITCTVTAVTVTGR